MYYVYVIKNTSSQKTYIGYSNDLKRRVREHISKNPELIYYEAYKSRKDAQNRERMLKQRGQSVRYLKQRIRNSLQE